MIANQEFRRLQLHRFIAERMVDTIHRGPAAFLGGVHRDYKNDFLRFAKSPSFLLYEIFDHLLDNYAAVHLRMQEQVDVVHLAVRDPPRGSLLHQLFVFDATEQQSHHFAQILCAGELGRSFMRMHMGLADRLL